MWFSIIIDPSSTWSFKTSAMMLSQLKQQHFCLAKLPSQRHCNVWQNCDSKSETFLDFENDVAAIW